ncbi:transcobalamin-1-like [Cololabis saira]|uniref:transcobalamin-1-like n=1 Tax=Cololabis saira TaxID=129043 RepID=UPI002AD53EAB|nr:transcobalamin-1-like [Cololabis saira]
MTTPTDDKYIYFVLVVENSIDQQELTEYYVVHVVPGGNLFGGLEMLQKENNKFTFTYTEDPNYGPFLESVNGVYGNKEEQTYWQLLEKEPNKEPVPLSVGMGSYIPREGVAVILNFTRW